MRELNLPGPLNSMPVPPPHMGQQLFAIENNPTEAAVPEITHEFSVFLPVLNEHSRVAAPGEKPGENYHNTIKGYLFRLFAEFGSNEQGKSFRLAIVDDGSQNTEEVKIAEHYGLDVICLDNQPQETPQNPIKSNRVFRGAHNSAPPKPNDTVTIAQQYGLDVFHSDPRGINRGRGIAYKVGFLSLAPISKVIGAYDGDGSYSPETVIEHYEAIREGHDLVVSYRPDAQDQHDTNVRALAHKLMYAACEPLAGTGIVKDPQAGAFAMSSAAALFLWDRKIKPRWAANRQIYHLAMLAGMDVVQIESEILTKGDSRMGTSYLKLMKSAARMVFDSADIGIRYSLSDFQEDWQAAKLALAA